MTRLERMCRTALTFAPLWGEAWALEHVRVALEGESRSELWEPGRRSNRAAYLGRRGIVRGIRAGVRRLLTTTNVFGGAS